MRFAIGLTVLEMLLTVSVEANDQNPISSEKHESESSVSNQEVSDGLSPMKGGNLVSVGGYTAEVLVTTGGQIRATVYRPTNALNKVQQIEVALRDSRQRLRRVDLTLNPRLQTFFGNVPSGVVPASGTLSMRVRDTQGQTFKGQTESLAVLPAPQHGGVVLAVGSYVFEMLVRRSGSVQAILREPNRLPTTSRPVMTVALQDEWSRPFPLTLIWHAPSRRFLGQAPPRVRFQSGPLDIHLALANQEVRGGIQLMNVWGRSLLGGHRITAGRYCVEVISRRHMLEAVLTDAWNHQVNPNEVVLELSVRDMEGNVHLLETQWNDYVGRYNAPFSTLNMAAHDIALIEASVSTPTAHRALNGKWFEQKQSGAISLPHAQKQNITAAQMTSKSRQQRDEANWMARRKAAHSYWEGAQYESRGSDNRSSGVSVDRGPGIQQSSGTITGGASDRGSISNGLGIGIY